MSVIESPAAFDPTDPLPTGVTLLEASAGTGKTYAIAQLAVRAVTLEDRPLSELLAVTFTRAATGELRERIRQRLAHTERLLATDRAAQHGDTLDRHLASGSPKEVGQRRERLQRALADFDAATIVTLHGFCQAVLSALGVAGDLDPDPTPVDDTGPLRDQVVGDLWLRKYLHQIPSIELRDAQRIAAAAIELPDADILPPDTGDHASPAETRARLARRTRIELERRKRRAGLLTYDDLLLRLRDALTGPDAGALCRRLRTQWQLVLVDEFQDTDPVQWAILQAAFAVPSQRLVLIGDPKQAIYAFRGADVQAYLGALQHTTAHRNLQTNWRSDRPLVDGLNALFAGAQLGDPRIAHRPATAHHPTMRLRDAPDPAPLRFRIVNRNDHRLTLTKMTRVVQVASARDFCAQDCAADISHLLAAGPTIEDPDTGKTRELVAGDVAVLCRRTENAHRLHRELAALNVPAVLAGAGSVFATAAAQQWLWLLEALERPSYESAARRAALTPFLGFDAEQLAAAGPPDLEHLHARLHSWARVLRTHGVAALTETISHAEGLAARVLASPGAERHLTDLRHVGELLHRAAAADGLGATALAAWLSARIQDARGGEPDKERTRRLETDQHAVQLLTIHGAKGLEFPVVYLPDSWDIFTGRKGTPARFHTPDGRRALDVGLLGGDYHAHWRDQQAEERSEDLRLLYVALTRARHQTTVWWAPTSSASDAPLTRLLLCRQPDGAIGPGVRGGPDEQDIRAALDLVAAEAPDGAVSVGDADNARAPALPKRSRRTDDLAARALGRQLDLSWRRTSYSALATGAREHRFAVSSETTAGLLTDEPDHDEHDPPVGTDSGVAALQAMPAGRHIGTAVHRALEHTTFTEPDLAAHLRDALAAAARRTATGLGDLTAVANGLADALGTPVPVLDNRGLTAIADPDRLNELAFELPLAGGDSPTGHVTLNRISTALQAHLPDGHAARSYADVLATPGLGGAFRGYLTGTIDLACRWRTPEDEWRFAICDYKTNRLPDYGPAALKEAMTDGHYWLQAVIYLVALHRHLALRLPGYDPNRHITGAAYLFVRGMTGPATPGAGVATLPATGPLLDALSACFD